MIVFVVDSTTKWLVRDQLALSATIEVFDGFFNFSHVHNAGAAFGLFGGLDSLYRVPFFTLTTTFAVAVILLLIHRRSEDEFVGTFALSLVLGGALGNFADRIRDGYVTDFLDFHWHSNYHFPSFNFADVAICTGVFLLLVLPSSRLAGEAANEPSADSRELGNRAF